MFLPGALNCLENVTGSEKSKVGGKYPARVWHIAATQPLLRWESTMTLDLSNLGHGLGINI